MRACDLEGDDVGSVVDLVTRGFGVFPADRVARMRETLARAIEGGRLLGVRDGGRLIASAGIVEMDQWWLGRSVPVAGITSVAVAPEDRGRGAGPLLMEAVLARAAGRGLPLSMLYPSTMAPYRRIGYERAGTTHWYTFPAHALRRLAPPGGARTGLRRVGEADAEAVVAVLNRVHAAGRHCGPTVRRPVEVPWWLRTDQAFAYLADDGLLAYTWADGERAIEVRYLAAASTTTMRTLWGLVASNAPMADRVHVVLAPDDPAFWLLRDPVAESRQVVTWMLRVLDVPAALTARGYPYGIGLSVPLTVENTTWRLTIADGTAHAEPAPDTADAPRLTTGGLAALYTGTPTPTLRLSGLLTGPAETDPALDAAFACRPFGLDSF